MLAVVSAAVFVVGRDLFIVNVAFPQIERSFGGASVASVSWVLNAYAIVLASLLIPAGRLADRSGRRRAFLLGLFVFAAGSALCGAAPALWVLIAARVLQAAGAALLLPTSLALLLPEFPPVQRAAAIGVWAAVGGIAAAVGPPIGGLLVAASWRLVFYVNVPVALVAVLFARRLLSESRDDFEQRSDPLGALLLAGSVALIALALVKAPDWRWADGRTLGTLAVGLLGLLGFWGRSHVHPSPVLDPALVRVRSFALANLSALLFSASFAAMLLACVLFMTGVWHYTTLSAGLALSPGSLLAALFAPPAGRLANRFGQATLGAIGTSTFALGCAWWLWQTNSVPDYAGQMLPGLVITGAGVGLTLPSLASAAVASLPPARFATGSAVFTMSRQLELVLGVSILIAIFGTTSRSNPVHTFDHAWLFMLIAGCLAAMAAAAIGTVRVASQPARSGASVASPAATLAPRG